MKKCPNCGNIKNDVEFPIYNTKCADCGCVKGGLVKDYETLRAENDRLREAIVLIQRKANQHIETLSLGGKESPFAEYVEVIAKQVLESKDG